MLVSSRNEGSAHIFFPSGRAPLPTSGQTLAGAEAPGGVRSNAGPRVVSPHPLAIGLVVPVSVPAVAPFVTVSVSRFVSRWCLGRRPAIGASSLGFGRTLVATPGPPRPRNSEFPGNPYNKLSSLLLGGPVFSPILQTPSTQWSPPSLTSSSPEGWSLNYESRVLFGSMCAPTYSTTLRVIRRLEGGEPMRVQMDGGTNLAHTHDHHAHTQGGWQAGTFKSRRHVSGRSFISIENNLGQRRDRKIRRVWDCRVWVCIDHLVPVVPPPTAS